MVKHDPGHWANPARNGRNRSGNGLDSLKIHVAGEFVAFLVVRFDPTDTHIDDDRPRGHECLVYEFWDVNGDDEDIGPLRFFLQIFSS